MNKQWICAPCEIEKGAISFEKILSCSGTVKKATACVSAVGVYAFFINGERIGKGVLAPGWTSYRHRVQYQTYDITSALSGRSELAIRVAPGWAVGYIGYNDTNHFFADHMAVVAWGTVEYRDGRTETWTTDADWDVYTTEILSSELYHGETVDKTAVRRRLGKALRDHYEGKLVPQVGEWITEHERLAPVGLIRTPKGETVIDFGQNLTGYAEIRIQANRGDRIVVHHAEVLDRDGNFYTENFRRARNENVYICSGGEDVFKPMFCFQGFRYLRLTEFPKEEVDLSAFRAIAVHSDIKRTGSFVCGNEKINQLYHNIIWGQKSNHLDIPTDCPQRDERLGWTGDVQIFCRTAAINFDVSRFYRKWLGEVALEQGEDGRVYGIVPNCLFGRGTRVSAAWGDVSCVTPWEMYLAYGDKKQLAACFPMMKKWVDYMHGAGSEEFLWLGGFHYGDWLAMDAGEDSYVGATANDLIATAFFARSADLVVRVGEELGEDVSAYRELYRNVRAAFRNYFMENGMPKAEFPMTEIAPAGHAPVDTVRRGMTQTALVLILRFGLCEPEEKKALEDKLEQLVHENGDLMATGFVGTPYLLHVLTDAGKTDLAYHLLFEERSPSWLYSVNHGATTMWEHWNSQKEDGSFWSTDMNSFNHYAYGSVFDWIFGVAVGIQPSSPAYRTVKLAPHPDRRLGFVDSGIETKSGKIRSAWYYKGDTVYYEFDVPDGVTASLTLPSGRTETLSAGSYRFAE